MSLPQPWKICPTSPASAAVSPSSDAPSRRSTRSSQSKLLGDSLKRERERETERQKETHPRRSRRQRTEKKRIPPISTAAPTLKNGLIQGFRPLAGAGCQPHQQEGPLGPRSKRFQRVRPCLLLLLVGLHGCLLGLVYLPSSGTCFRQGPLPPLLPARKSANMDAPQLTVTIKKDLDLTPAQVANSNIVSLCAT